jgi:hypothetical protein
MTDRMCLLRTPLQLAAAAGFQCADNVPILLYGTTGVPKLSFRGVRARYFLQEVDQDAPLVSLGS